MPKYIGDSKVPVMEFCEYCWATLNEDSTCPTEGCIHDELMELDDGNEDETTTSPTQL